MKLTEMNQNSQTTVKKLQLKKETIKVLHGPELSLVAGGTGGGVLTAIRGAFGPALTDGCPTVPLVSCVCQTNGDSCNCNAGVSAPSWCPCGQ